MDAPACQVIICATDFMIKLDMASLKKQILLKNDCFNHFTQEAVMNESKLTNKILQIRLERIF